MKILFYRYGSIVEPDIIEGFTVLGHQIYQITNEITDKNTTPQQTIKLVSDYLLEHPMDFVFSINFYPVISEVCNIFKIPYLCWIVDSPVMTLYSHSITNKFNRIFLFDEALYNEFHPYNQECIFHLPLATNVNRIQNTLNATSMENSQKFSSDVSFVGSLYTEKCPYDRLTNPGKYLKGYLNGLMEAQIRVYGYYFIDELLSDEMITEFKEHLPGFYTFPENSFKNDRAAMSQLYIGNKIAAMERCRIMDRLSNSYDIDIYTASDTSFMPKLHNRGLANTLNEMPFIFHNSKINLNITCKSIRCGIPLRIFDILGCEGFLISNYQTELPQNYILNEDLVTYSSIEELDELVDYYLNHKKQAKEIAHNGYLKTKLYHTYEIRLEQMLHTAFNKF